MQESYDKITEHQLLKGGNMLDTFSQPSVESRTLYDEDFYAWTQQQAQMIASGDWKSIDRPNLVEEIESLGKQQRQEMRNRLGILLAHLLKWEYQSQKRSRSWLSTIRVQRQDLLDLLQESPSLKPYLEEAMAKAYLKAKNLAMGETNLPSTTFPAQCPYTWSETTDEQFYPGEPDELLNEQ